MSLLETSSLEKQRQIKDLTPDSEPILFRIGREAEAVAKADRTHQHCLLFCVFLLQLYRTLGNIKKQNLLGQEYLPLLRARRPKNGNKIAPRAIMSASRNSF